MTDLYILPGLDGTTRMLDIFITAARTACVGRNADDVRAIAYPLDQPLGYAELDACVRAALPTLAPFVLLGESFSGPIAIAIAADPPPNLVGLVLSTTFARAPVPLLAPFASLTRFAPTRALPTAALSAVLLGRWSTPEVRHTLRAALAEVAPSVQRARAAAAMRVDMSDRLARITVPTLTLTLKANHDRLLRAGAGRLLLAQIANARQVALDGPHLLLAARTAKPAQRASAESASQENSLVPRQICRRRGCRDLSMRHPAALKNGAHRVRRPPGLRLLAALHHFAMCRRRGGSGSSSGHCAAGSQP